MVQGRVSLCVRGYLALENPDSAKLNASLHHVKCLQLDDYVIESKSNVQSSLESFIKIEELGVSCSP